MVRLRLGSGWTWNRFRSGVNVELGGLGPAYAKVRLG